jgi:pyruvate kinase
MNLPGVNVDLPTITDKDTDDLVNWGVKNKVDFVAASFVRKGSDLDHIRAVLGDAATTISIISKVENLEVWQRSVHLHPSFTSGSPRVYRLGFSA